MNPNTGNGKGVRWLREHADYASEFCLIWPFHRNVETGYATFGLNGELLYAHRFMCELVNGPPPTPAHEAAHSCGNGRGGCINPRHLIWKTISENNLDCRKHGTQAKNKFGPRGFLTDAQVDEIRALRGKLTQREIADRFGCSPSTVRDIYLGRSRARPRKRKILSDAEVLEIRRFGRSKTAAEMSRMFGVSEGTIVAVRNGRSWKNLRDAG